MKKILAIVDSEQLFARRLANYISKFNVAEYEIGIFTSAEIFMSTINGTVVDLLVADSVNYERLCELDFRSKLLIDNIKILGDETDIHFFYEEGNYIYKYQSAKIICNLIFGNNCLGIKNEETVSNKDLKLIVKNKVQEKLIRLGECNDNETLKVIDECIDNESIGESYKKELRNSVFYAVRGLDVLEEFISDESITEIMVNGENKIFYEREGRLVSSHKSFDSRDQLRDIIQKIVSSANRVVNLSSPIVDARLADGSRVNVVLDPISLSGPILTIRRFPTDPLTAEKLIAYSAVSEEIMNMLRKLVYAGYNILVSGSTGSGKTTFLNILSGYIPKDERIITIEDSAELKIMGIDNLVRLESRNANLEGCLKITIRDLIRSALRMRPDRIIVGEVRGDEAIDMIQAFTVGQEGSMSTIHANSASDALYRLEMLMMLGGVDMPLNAIRRQISIGVDIIIHLGRLKDKSRKLLEICEVTDFRDGEIITSPLYRFDGIKFVKTNDICRTYKLEKAGCI